MGEFACVKKDYLFLHDFQKDFDEDLKGELIIKMLITVVNLMLEILGDQRWNSSYLHHLVFQKTVALVWRCLYWLQELLKKVLFPFIFYPIFSPSVYVCEKNYLEKSWLLPHGCGFPVVKPFHAFRKSEAPLHSSALCGKSWADIPKPEGKDVSHGTSCSVFELQSKCNLSNPFFTFSFTCWCSVRFWYKDCRWKDGGKS